MQSAVKEIASEYELKNQKKRVERSAYTVSKRAFDILASAVAIILLSPVLMIISAMVYLGDPGPVIYGQIRIGKNGKPFKMWMRCWKIWELKKHERR